MGYFYFHLMSINGHLYNLFDSIHQHLNIILVQFSFIFLFLFVIAPLFFSWSFWSKMAHYLGLPIHVAYIPYFLFIYLLSMQIWTSLFKTEYFIL